jgi:hypothetical protein
MNMWAWSAISISIWGRAMSGWFATRSTWIVSMDGRDTIMIGVLTRSGMTVFGRTVTDTCNRAVVDRKKDATIGTKACFNNT